MTLDSLPAAPVTGDISREHWTVPVPGGHPEAGGTITLTAHADGTATLRLTRDPAVGSDQRILVLDVTTAAQLSVGIWAAAGVAQRQLTGRLGASSLVTAASPRRSVPRRRPRGGGARLASVNGSAAVNEGGTVNKSGPVNKGGAGDAAEVADVRGIGWRVHRIRKSQDKPLRVIAELAAMSIATLHRIEHGKHAVTLLELVRLATALQVPPSELTKLPVPAPANGHSDSATEAVRLALDAIEVGRPGGLVLPVVALRDQVARILVQRRACQFAQVATDLSGLIRNLHTTLATGADHAELLELAVSLHVHVTRLWLSRVAAPDDLVRRVVFLARRLAQERDDVMTLAVAGFSVADTLLASGAIEPGRAELDSITLPPTTAGAAGLVCAVTSVHAHAALLDGRSSEVAELMDAAAELGERFGGETESVGFGHPGADVDGHRVLYALEAGEPDQAARIAQEGHSKRHPYLSGRAFHWLHYGRALAELRGRRDDAVCALRTAEDIFPTLVRRHPLVRDAIATLLPRARRDALGTELRGLAHRAGLSV
ncbi:MAG: helix-turn-helix domain-containing protein [Pseudonocardiaceae bacterium]